jgi:hypothetical protein
MTKTGFVHIAVSGVGKSTQKQAGTAAAKVRYACRGSACFDVVTSGNIPADVKGAEGYFNRKENALRSNGRVAECLELGLPKEAANHNERKIILVSFLKRMGMTNYIAGFHKPTEGSPNNWHVHVVGEASGWNAGGFPKKLREAWCSHLNRWSKSQQIDLHFDPRTLEEQAEAARAAGDTVRAAELEGRQPRHIGPNIRAIAAKKAPDEIRPHVRIRLQTHQEDQSLILEKRRVRGRNRSQGSLSR